MAAEEGVVTLQGRQIVLPSGAMVWGGKHPDRQSYVWKFISAEGAVTTLNLSSQAMTAVIHLFQALAGCDIDFASMEVEPAPSAGEGKHGG